MCKQRNRKIQVHGCDTFCTEWLICMQVHAFVGRYKLCEIEIVARGLWYHLRTDTWYFFPIKHPTLFMLGSLLISSEVAHLPPLPCYQRHQWDSYQINQMKIIIHSLTSLRLEQKLTTILCPTMAHNPVVFTAEFIFAGRRDVRFVTQADISIKWDFMSSRQDPCVNKMKYCRMAFINDIFINDINYLNWIVKINLYI